MIEEAFAKILRRLRIQKNMSQESFGYAVGIHRTYVSQLERGLKSPSLKTLCQITDVLDISLTELMHLIEQEMQNAK